jgi:hypothetical protein
MGVQSASTSVWTQGFLAPGALWEVRDERRLRRSSWTAGLGVGEACSKGGYPCSCGNDAPPCICRELRASSRGPSSRTRPAGVPEAGGARAGSCPAAC